MPTGTEQTALRRLEALLAGPHVTRWAVLIALLLTLPSVGTGLVVDDHAHLKFVRMQLQGAPELAAVPWWDMFDIAGRGGRWDVLGRIFIGLLPWWSSLDLSMAFLRPLGVASHFIDYGLWPGQPWAMHVHNLCWYAGLVALVGVYYRRVMGIGLAAGLAVLMYAVDEAHAEGASWIASRNTLMTAFFVLLTLVLHDRARRDGWKHALWLAPLAHLAALLCSEGGTAVFAYLLPYAALIDTGRVRARALSLLPFVLLTALWQVVYRRAGYGIYGSGLYLDPGDDLPRFIAALPERLPLVLRDQFVLPPMLLEGLPTELHLGANTLAFAALALLAIAGLCAAMAAPSAELARRLAFWSCGALASAVPICAIGSTPRLQFITALGAFGFIAELIAHVRGRSAWSAQDAGRGTATAGEATATGAQPFVAATAILFLILHVPLAAALSPSASTRLVAYDDLIKDASRSFPWGDDLAGKGLFVLNTPNYFVTTFAWAYVEGPAPKSAHILGTSMGQVDVTREAVDSLLLAPKGGYLLEPWSTLVRRADEAFAPGYKVRIADMWIEVVDVTPDGRPARVRCTLADMGSDAFVWVYWNSATRRYERTELPAVGRTLRIAAETDPSLQLNAGELR